jgi:hypothetical protein
MAGEIPRRFKCAYPLAYIALKAAEAGQIVEVDFEYHSGGEPFLAADEVEIASQPSVDDERATPADISNRWIDQLRRCAELSVEGRTLTPQMINFRNRHPAVLVYERVIRNSTSEQTT